jgi:hypothetical protein
LRPYLTTNLTESNRPFCDIKVTTNAIKVHRPHGVCTSFPRCLLQVAVEHFCKRTQDTKINQTWPNRSINKGGAWSSYKFSSYSISGLYIGVEIDRNPSRKEHEYTIHSNDSTPDAARRHTLMLIVDDCIYNEHFTRSEYNANMFYRRHGHYRSKVRWSYHTTL